MMSPKGVVPHCTITVSESTSTCHASCIHVMMYTVLYSRVALSMVGAAAVALGLPRLGNPDLWQ